MDTWAARLIDDLHPYRTVPNDGLGLGQRVGYGVNSHDAIAIAHAFQTKRIADALEKLADHTTRASAQPVDETERLRAALEKIAASRVGLQGIQEDHGHDTNAYNYHAMKYWAGVCQQLQWTARAALTDTKGDRPMGDR